jgi:hypothetical protein
MNKFINLNFNITWLILKHQQKYVKRELFKMIFGRVAQVPTVAFTERHLSLLILFIIFYSMVNVGRRAGRKLT